MRGPAASSTVGLRPAAATGITSDHFCIIVSYSDVASSAIGDPVRGVPVPAAQFAMH